MVWVGISASKVDGPYFFEVTINQFNYVEMLKDFFGRNSSVLLLSKSITFNKMEPLLTDLTSIKNCSKINLVVNSWTRKNGPQGHPT